MLPSALRTCSQVHRTECKGCGQVASVCPAPVNLAVIPEHLCRARGGDGHTLLDFRLTFRPTALEHCTQLCLMVNTNVRANKLCTGAAHMNGLVDLLNLAIHTRLDRWLGGRQQQRRAACKLLQIARSTLLQGQKSLKGQRSSWLRKAIAV